MSFSGGGIGVAVPVNKKLIKPDLMPERQPRRRNSGVESWGRRPVRGPETDCTSVLAIRDHGCAGPSAFPALFQCCPVGGDRGIPTGLRSWGFWGSEIMGLVFAVRRGKGGGVSRACGVGGSPQQGDPLSWRENSLHHHCPKLP